MFPTPGLVPAILFYDSACCLKQHLEARGNHHFDACAMPVNVFHMKSKHKESDEYCGRHCNPLLFPELVVNNRWRFNSSAAEMTNAWFGGFQAICREMREDRYDFFLDEMIKIRNRMIVQDLQNSNSEPRNIPREVLLS